MLLATMVCAFGRKLINWCALFLVEWVCCVCCHVSINYLSFSLVWLIWLCLRCQRIFIFTKSLNFRVYSPCERSVHCEKQRIWIIYEISRFRHLFTFRSFVFFGKLNMYFLVASPLCYTIISIESMCNSFIPQNYLHYSSSHACRQWTRFLLTSKLLPL